MSALDKYAQNKREFINTLEVQGIELNEAAQSNSKTSARETLKATADATNELFEYLNSPVIDRVIETFHTSATERAQAATDLKKYLTDAGLVSSDRVKWELHDNNWCVDGQVTYHEGNTVHGVSAHYDSQTGWGWGVC